jgi:hypothetical protein
VKEHYFESAKNQRSAWQHYLSVILISLAKLYTLDQMNKMIGFSTLKYQVNEVWVVLLAIGM